MKFGKKLKIFSKKNLIVNSISRKYLKAKIKSYNGKININFHNNKISKEGSQFTCSSVILIDSVFITDKNYYLQVFLEECKYVVKEKKILSILLKFLLILIEKILIEENSEEENFEVEN